MILGKRQVEIGEYQAADLTFRKVLNLKTFIPDDLCYYYGETLYRIKKYRLSQTFLVKYIELTDSNAVFFDTTNSLLNLVNAKITDIDNCEVCDEDGFKIESIACPTCSGDGLLHGPCNRCHGSGEEVCKVCLGEKVEIQKTSFGRRYIPCTNCNETGFVPCSKCNGKGALDYKCQKCEGVGELSKRVRVIE